MSTLNLNIKNKDQVLPIQIQTTSTIADLKAELNKQSTNI